MKDKAKQFATQAHKGQLRKNSNEPYITHPIRVAKRLEESGFSNELVAAGYLHDVVEDTSIGMKEIKHTFGEKVAEIVSAHTEDKSKSWKERKQHTIDMVRTTNKEIKYLIVADKLDNLLSIESSLKSLGNVIWENFNAGYDEQKWYNESIARNMYEGLDHNEIPVYFQTYEKAIKRVFG
ncbi:MAG TPA: HD domain-containing protein [Bacillota bacterium]|nr:HD domain-containing protein [Bacillota bacterium]